MTVDEVDVARVRVGQDVNITLDSLPGLQIKGKVDRIAPTSTIVNGVVSGVTPVRVVLTNPDPALKIGMTANAAVVLERDNALARP